jgi:hypothetical protein
LALRRTVAASAELNVPAFTPCVARAFALAAWLLLFSGNLRPGNAKILSASAFLLFVVSSAIERHLLLEIVEHFMVKVERTRHVFVAHDADALTNLVLINDAIAHVGRVCGSVVNPHRAGAWMNVNVFGRHCA